MEHVEVLRTALPAKLRGLRDAKVVQLARECWGYVNDPRVPTGYKVLAVGALLYLVNPADAVPDWIPVGGYADDAAALGALVLAVRNILAAAAEATKEVVDHGVQRMEEAWTRRGVGQIALGLWAASLAACLGLAYHVGRALLVPGHDVADPFLWAAVVTAGAGAAYHARLGWQTWTTYTALPAFVQAPLAEAVARNATRARLAGLVVPIAALVGLGIARAVLVLVG
ncbi:MAG: DUF1232 domain-containing protein [bacterium]|nr:DUF1232 domain-containing protein [bacterium]